MTDNGPRTTDHGHARRGVTLVELLITILIIGILASLILGVASVAGESAREAKTRSMISRLHTLLVEQYDSYRNRRVKVRQEVIKAIDDDTSLTAAERGQKLALARLYALRELILMEMPDRWSDVLLSGVPSSPAGVSDALYPVYLNPLSARLTGSAGPLSYRTPLAALYLRQYARITDSNGRNKLTNQRNTQEEILAYQGAECLYMVIVNATGDGEARTLFHEDDIGDVDGDGAPEFLDGWGHPIGFLRWAPGFDSEIQANATLLGDPPANPTWTAEASRDHDPFDLFRVDPAAFRLVPLVFSAGRDELILTPVGGQPYENYGMAMPYPVDFTWPGVPSADYPFDLAMALPSPYRKIAYDADGAQVYVGQDVYLGTGSSERPSVDNIHNHLIGTR